MMTDIGEVAAVEVQPNIDHTNCDIKIEFDDVSGNLARGLLAIYQLPLERVGKELIELKSNQENLITQMRVENEKFHRLQNSQNSNELFSTIKIYREKLTRIKKEMVSVHDRIGKLKKRALRLQQTKQKEALQKEQQREQEIRREEELIGKPSS